MLRTTLRATARFDGFADTAQSIMQRMSDMLTRWLDDAGGQQDDAERAENEAETDEGQGQPSTSRDAATAPAAAAAAVAEDETVPPQDLQAVKEIDFGQIDMKQRQHQTSGVGDPKPSQQSVATGNVVSQSVGDLESQSVDDAAVVGAEPTGGVVDDSSAPSSSHDQPSSSHVTDDSDIRELRVMVNELKSAACEPAVSLCYSTQGASTSHIKFHFPVQRPCDGDVSARDDSSSSSDPTVTPAAVPAARNAAEEVRQPGASGGGQTETTAESLVLKPSSESSSQSKTSDNDTELPQCKLEETTETGGTASKSATDEREDSGSERTAAEGAGTAGAGGHHLDQPSTSRGYERWSFPGQVWLLVS